MTKKPKKIPVPPLPNDHFFTFLFGLGLGFVSIWSEWGPFHEDVSSPKVLLGNVLAIIALAGFLFEFLRPVHGGVEFSSKRSQMSRKIARIALVFSFLGSIWSWYGGAGHLTLLLLFGAALFAWLPHVWPRIVFDERERAIWKYQFSVERLDFREIVQMEFREPRTLLLLSANHFIYPFEFPSKEEAMEVYEKLKASISPTKEGEEDEQVEERENFEGTRSAREELRRKVLVRRRSLGHKILFWVLGFGWSWYWVMWLWSFDVGGGDFLSFGVITVWLLGLWGAEHIVAFLLYYGKLFFKRGGYYQDRRLLVFFLFFVFPSALLSVGLSSYHFFQIFSAVELSFLPFRDLFMDLLFFNLGMYVLLDPSEVFPQTFS